ncbi:hypothetical protein PQ456_13175 [Paenibacillus kyungheensis]|uniref:Uncharacterized protein n=3 Tax=Paenibacillus TaxID=44249 RepID=A0AAX3LW75_9BACL|nr:hypothetical protein [Paenibacillus kyungheensis]WCT54155.1 hypothetical protein PQ456_13175 [Paenibacillus kyungheensis]
MQTEELKMQREETTRSADQLEMQQQLMNYQLILTTVNDLIKLKSGILVSIETSYSVEVSKVISSFGSLDSYLNILADDSRKPTRSPLSYQDRQNFKQYIETCFFLLQFVIESQLTVLQIDNLKKIIKVNLSENESIVLKRFAQEDSNQHQLALIKIFNLFSS